MTILPVLRVRQKVKGQNDGIEMTNYPSSLKSWEGLEHEYIPGTTAEAIFHQLVGRRLFLLSQERPVAPQTSPRARGKGVEEGRKGKGLNSAH